MRTSMFAKVLTGLAGILLPASASGDSVVMVSVPGSTSTMLNGINDAGLSVGSYSVGNTSSGFMRGSTGVITTFVEPGSISTFGQGVDDAGVVVGYALTPLGSYLGYIRNTDGTFSTFNVPGSQSTYPNSINNLGQIAGTYSFSGFDFHGFVRNPNGSLTSFDVPGATGTFAQGISDSGAVVGYYLKGSSFGAFMRSPDGAFTYLNVPGGSATFASGINDSGQLVGYYLTSYFTSGGLVTLSTGLIHNPDGSITSFDVPGSTTTYIQGINNLDQIAGSYVNNGTTYGFLTVPEPSSLILLNIGIFCLMLLGRRGCPR